MIVSRGGGIAKVAEVIEGCTFSCCQFIRFWIMRSDTVGLLTSLSAFLVNWTPEHDGHQIQSRESVELVRRSQVFSGFVGFSDRLLPSICNVCCLIPR